MGYSAYATITNILAQGVLSSYNGRVTLLGRSDQEFMVQAFTTASVEQERAYILSLWYSNVLIACFALWTYAIVRSANVNALPQKFKVIAYFSCIPLAVLCQWVANTCALYMYLDYISDGTVNTLTTLLWYIFQIGTWVMQGLCLISILVSIGGQMRYSFCKKKDRW